LRFCSGEAALAHKRPLPGRTFSAHSIRGATSLQGPHQTAQKSTSTGLSLCGRWQGAGAARSGTCGCVPKWCSQHVNLSLRSADAVTSTTMLLIGDESKSTHACMACAIEVLLWAALPCSRCSDAAACMPPHRQRCVGVQWAGHNSLCQSNSAHTFSTCSFQASSPSISTTLAICDDRVGALAMDGALKLFFTPEDTNAARRELRACMAAETVWKSTVAAKSDK
jgi:hypothetical protein